MKTEELQLLISSPNNKNIRFKLLNEFIAELTDLDWHNIIFFFEKIEINDRISALNLCIACMNMLYINEKKYITNEQLLLIFKDIPLGEESEAYELLKPFFNCSVVKMEGMLALLYSGKISNTEIKLKFLKDFVVELTNLDWNNIVSLVVNFNGSDAIYTLKLCIDRLNYLYKDPKKYITAEQVGLILKKVAVNNEPETYELLRPFINVSTNIQNLCKFIKYIRHDSRKIEYAKISLHNIETLSNVNLHSIINSMQDDVFKIKFIELFADKIEISDSNLLTLINMIPTARSNVITLFIAKGLKFHIA